MHARSQAETWTARLLWRGLALVRLSSEAGVSGGRSVDVRGPSPVAERSDSAPPGSTTPTGWSWPAGDEGSAHVPASPRRGAACSRSATHSRVSAWLAASCVVIVSIAVGAVHAQDAAAVLPSPEPTSLTSATVDRSVASGSALADARLAREAERSDGALAALSDPSLDVVGALDRPLAVTLSWPRAAARLDESLAALRSRIDGLDSTVLASWRARIDTTALEREVAAHEGDVARLTLWQAALDATREAEARIQAAERRLAELQSRPDALAATLAALNERMAQGLREVLRARDVDLDTASLSEIEAAIAQLESEMAQRAADRAERERLIERLESQRGALPVHAGGSGALADGADRALEQAAALRALPEGVTQEVLDAADLTAAYRAWREALALDAEMQARVAAFDQQLLDPRIDALRLESALEEWRDRVRGLAMQALRSAVELRSNADIEALRARLRALVQSDPLRFEGSSFERDTLQTLDAAAGRLAQASRALQLAREAEQLESELATTLAEVRERLEIGGLTDVLGGVLIEEERRIRRLGDFSAALRDVERDLAQARLRQIGLRDELRRAERLQSAFEFGVRGDPLLVPIPDAGSAARDDTLALSFEALTLLDRAERQLIENLVQAERALQRLVETRDTLAALLRESLLWWPSHRPMGSEWWGAVPAASLALFDPDTWAAMREALRHAVTGQPLWSILALLLAAGVALAGREARRHLRDLATQTRHRYTDRLALTWSALGWTVLRVLPVPILLAALGWRLTQIEPATREIEVVAFVTLSVALWWTVAHLLYLFTSADGVARAHFRWPEPLLKRLRLEMAWFLPTMLALTLLAAAAFGHPLEVVADVWGRLALMGVIVAAGVFAWRMLAPMAGERDADEAQGSGPATHQQSATQAARRRRRRRFVRGALLLAFIVLFGLTAAGYVLTVATLLERAINTVIVAVVAWIGYSLGARALVLSEVRLQIRRLREARAREAAPADAAVGEGAVIEAEPSVSIENVNAQTRSLLRVTTGTGVVLALLWVWADILPALTWLDGITLWSRTITVGESEILSRVSLQDFLLALFLGAMFTLAARNLPGLVEILLSRSALLDAAGRYTVTTLLRYVLAVVAVISVFSLLGLRWSELQWMVAALTLGLGFGLQEVVANFVSGLIMLFERPVRVGDTITIGEYSGTVSKIRTRATTIVDWDNREIVVPNKMFITERLINWTLSDTMTRVVIPVGVSYQSDPDEVMQTLLEVARSCPQVLPEPVPQVLFLRLGNSTLDFELRVYVGQMRDRLITTSDLNRQIVRRFRERNIEIAYPQLDLHLRDWAPPPSTPTATPLAVVGAGAGGAQEPGTTRPEPLAAGRAGDPTGGRQG